MAFVAAPMMVASPVVAFLPLMLFVILPGFFAIDLGVAPSFLVPLVKVIARLMMIAGGLPAVALAARALGNGSLALQHGCIGTRALCLFDVLAVALVVLLIDGSLARAPLSAKFLCRALAAARA